MPLTLSQLFCKPLFAMLAMWPVTQCAATFISLRVVFVEKKDADSITF